jgi:hypothetical protein
MTVTRINGCPLNLRLLSREELERLIEQVGRNMDQIERELAKLNEELVRRSTSTPAA